MKKYLLYIVLAYVALSIQAILFKGPCPDFILVLVCFYSLKYGRAKGLAYGAFTGLLLDTASGFILGPHIISKSLAGFFARTIRTKVFQWNIFINTIVITVFTLIDILLVYFCLETFSPVSFANRPWKMSVIQLIYTVISSLLLYTFLHPEKDYAVTNG